MPVRETFVVPEEVRGRGVDMAIEKAREFFFRTCSAVAKDNPEVYTDERNRTSGIFTEVKVFFLASHVVEAWVKVTPTGPYTWNFGFGGSVNTDPLSRPWRLSTPMTRADRLTRKVFGQCAVAFMPALRLIEPCLTGRLFVPFFMQKYILM